MHKFAFTSLLIRYPSVEDQLGQFRRPVSERFSGGCVACGLPHAAI